MLRAPSASIVIDFQSKMNENKNKNLISIIEEIEHDCR